MRMYDFTTTVLGSELAIMIRERAAEIDEDAAARVAEIAARPVPKPYVINGVEQEPLPIHPLDDAARIKRDIGCQTRALRRIADVLAPTRSYDLTVLDLQALGLLPRQPPPGTIVSGY